MCFAKTIVNHLYQTNRVKPSLLKKVLLLSGKLVPTLGVGNEQIYYYVYSLLDLVIFIRSSLFGYLNQPPANLLFFKFSLTFKKM